MSKLTPDKIVMLEETYHPTPEEWAQTIYDMENNPNQQPPMKLVASVIRRRHIEKTDG